MNDAAIKVWRAQKNIGPVMAPLLVAAGISVEDLQAGSVEDIFWRFWQFHQNLGYAHSAYLYALHGAKHNLDWRAVPEEDKQRYKQFMKDFKASWQV